MQENRKIKLRSGRRTQDGRRNEEESEQSYLTLACHVHFVLPYISSLALRVGSKIRKLTCILDGLGSLDHP